MKIKDKSFINILNMILIIIVTILIIIGICCTFLKDDISNAEVGELGNITEYSNNESNMKSWRVNYKSGNNIYEDPRVSYEEINGETIGSIKLSTTKTFDMNDWFDRYAYKYVNGEPSLEKVSTKIKEGTLTKSGANIIIDDENEKHYGYSNKWYSIEKKNGEEWEVLKLKKEMVIPEEEDIPTIYTDISEFSIDWTEYYGELEKGTYRIAKKTYVYDTDYESVYIYTEFEIK